MPHIQAPPRAQLQLPNLEEFIEQTNTVRVIDAFVDNLDLSTLGFERVTAKTEGRPAYHPSIMLKLYLYGYLNGVRSSRKLERECRRNLELHWLLQGLFPAYHTIADFRKDNPLPLKNLFATFTHFLTSQGLIGADTIGLDGSKFRAINSKKNNYNSAKIKRHLCFLAQKSELYLKELQAADLAEQAVLGQEASLKALQAKRENIQAKLKELAGRQEKYLLLRERVKGSEDGQVSTTDPESRALILHRKIVEVAYNLQTVVDDKHKLITYCCATNRNDAKALYPMVQAAKHILGVSSLTVLADKGYHNGEQLRSCQRENIITLVAYRAHVERGPGPTAEYYSNKFIYCKKTDTYTCPQGHQLTTNGKSYNKYRKKLPYPYTFKRYLTPACQNCSAKELCTNRKYGRNIDRTEYAEAIEDNNQRVDQQKELYNQRQAICEHPFGTIKRAWGYSYTLLKGLKKVNGEMALICTIYNLRRSLTILGAEKLIGLLKVKKLQIVTCMLSDFGFYRSFNLFLVMQDNYLILAPDKRGIKVSGSLRRT